MKNFLLMLCALDLLSCASTPPRYTATLDDTYKDGAVGVSLVGLAPDGSPSPEGLIVKCVNASAAPVTVEWVKSTFSLGSAPHPVFVEADGYGDLRGAPPETPLAAGSNIVETVYPANRVVTMAGGWGPPKLDTQPFGSEQVSLSICVNVSGQDRFYTLKVDMEPQAAAPVQATAPRPEGQSMR